MRPIRQVRWILCLALIGWHAQAYGQQLTQAATGLPDLRASASAWGDLDGDGDLDLALAGLDTAGQSVTKIFMNNGGVLTEDPQQKITGIAWGDLAWGDFDNDGKLDLAISGQGQAGNGLFGVSEVYRNVNDVLTRDPAQLVGPPPFFEVKILRYSSVAWADYNNDGKLDLLIAGIDRNGFVTTKLYTNQNNILTENVSQSVVAVKVGAVDWGDFNGDGLPDLAVMGLDDEGLRTTTVYLNEKGLFIEAADISLTKVFGGDLAWGDYDRDGNLDLAVSGWDEHWNAVLKIYRNNALRGTLEEQFSLQAGGRGLVGSLAWGDFDNDGDPDLAVAGRNEITGLSTVVFRNDNAASFTLANEPALVGVMNGSAAWGDVNNDARLDLLVSGEQADGTLRTALYTSSGAANTPPGAPALTSPVATSKGIVFRWTEGADAETPNAALTYNLRLGTTPGGNELFSAAVRGGDANKGAGTGNVGRILVKRLDFPVQVDTLYWSVQSVDGGFERSAFAAEDTIVIDRLVNSEQQLTGLRQNLFGQGLVWGDYNNDGWIDLITAGQDINGDTRTILYRNDAGTLNQDEGSAINGLENGAVALGDFDNDGDLDLFQSGEDRFGNGFTFLYKNTGGLFEVDPDQPGIAGLNLKEGSAAWGDYTNDGRLDLAVSGRDRTGTARTYLYKNVPGDTLVLDDAQTLTGTTNGALAWGDIDGDGDLDLVISGQGGLTFSPTLEVYKNTGGLLTKDLTQNLPGFLSSALAFGDFDADGDLDLAVNGGRFVGSALVSEAVVYRNDGAGFFSEAQTLDGIQSGASGALGGTVAWGDFDNDGDLDLVLTGQEQDAAANSRIVTIVYRNEAGILSRTPFAVLPDVVFSASAWADYDKDRDLDLVLTGGVGESFTEQAQIFDNLTGQTSPNAVPNPPISLTAEPLGSNIVLSWDEGADSETPAAGLTYSMRVGTSPGGHDIVSGVGPVGMGNLGTANFDTLKNLPDSTYYWGIRAIDNGLAVSEEATERRFIIDTTAPSIDSVSIDPPVVGIGTVVNMVIRFKERVGLDLSIPPTVTLSSDPGVAPSFPVQQISYSGSDWAGSFTIGDSIPTSTLFIGVSGATDLLGNVLAATAKADSFKVTLQSKVVVSQGGRIQGGANNVSLYIPPNTFSTDQEVSISSVPTTDPILVKTLGAGGTASAKAAFVHNTAFLVEPADLVLKEKKPGTLTIRYLDSDVNDETILAIFRWNETTQQWDRIGGTVDPARNTVTTVITRLGTYAVFEDADVKTSSVALANFRMQPRVLSPKGNRFNTTEASISFNLGQAFPVTIEVYNIAGQLERVICHNKMMGPGTMVEMWNGRDGDGDIVKSGLYIITIDAGGHQSKQAVAILND